MQLTDRELATVLAALRYWQQDMVSSDSQEQGGPISPHFDELEPLSTREIDDLCERLNLPTGNHEPRFEALCRQVAETAESWADCTDPRESAAMFKYLGQQCRAELAAQGAPEKSSLGYVLYDFDGRSLVTTTVFDSYQDAAEAAHPLSNVQIVTIDVVRRVDADDGPIDEAGRCDCERPGFYYSGVPGILARLQYGRVAPGAKVERCDACERFPSDEAAIQKLIELGIAPMPCADPQLAGGP